MKRILERLVRAWKALIGRDELERRGISFANAALEHLETSEQWGPETCRLIAHEAVLRRLADSTVAGGGYFDRTVDGIILSHLVAQTPREKIHG